jgi:hypothetical protein
MGSDSRNLYKWDKPAWVSIEAGADVSRKISRKSRKNKDDTIGEKEEIEEMSWPCFRTVVWSSAPFAVAILVFVGLQTAADASFVLTALVALFSGAIIVLARLAWVTQFKQRVKIAPAFTEGARMCMQTPETRRARRPPQPEY